MQPSSAYAVQAAAVEGAHHMEHSEQPMIGHRSSNQSMHNNSMTLHTKLAMREINNYWGSPVKCKLPSLFFSLGASLRILEFTDFLFSV